MQQSLRDLLVEPPPAPMVGAARKTEHASVSGGPEVEGHSRTLSRPEDVSTCNGRGGAKQGVWPVLDVELLERRAADGGRS